MKTQKRPYVFNAYVGLLAGLLLTVLQYTPIQAQTQLGHWPLFQPGSAEIEIDFTVNPVTSISSGYPAATDKTGNPLTQYRAMNAFHDNNGNLLFYVVCDDVDTYIYDASGSHFTQPLSGKNHVPSTSSSEIGIVPIPNTCLSGFHVLVGGKIIVINLKDKEMEWMVGSSTASYSSGIQLTGGGRPGGKDYPMAIGEIREGSYTVYTVEAYGPGITGRFVMRNDITFCTGRVDWFSQPGITRSTFRDITQGPNFLVLTRFTDYVSEMEVSPDRSHMAFSDDNHVFVLGMDAAGNRSGVEKMLQFPHSSHAGGNTNRIGGIEFSADNQKLVFSYFDRATGSTAGGIGIWDFNNSTTATFIPNTIDYGRSQIELGRDTEIYVTGPSALDIVDVNVNAMVSTGILASALTLNEPVATSPGFDNWIRTLPDQIDGYDYVSFNNNPNFSYTDTVEICYNTQANLNALDLGSCYGFSGTVNWSPSGMLVSSSNFSATTVHLAFDQTFTASYTNAFGCEIKEVFFVDVSEPPYSTINTIDVCEGEDATVEVQCSGSTVEWLAPASLAGSNAQVVIALDVQQNEEYTYRCLDSNGCELYTHTTHLNVIDLLGLDTTVVPICEGQSVNLNDYLPIGFSCGWTDDITGLPVSNPVVSPSQSRPYTATCPGSQGCEITKQVYVDVVQQAVVLPYLNLNICEGDFVDHTLFVPGGWELVSEIIVGTNQVTYRYASYDANGCLTYNDIIVNYLPKRVHNITVPANCMQEINLDAYNGYCSGYGLVWYDGTGQNPVSPLQYLSTSTDFVGKGHIIGVGCCEVRIHVEVPEPEVLNAEVCMGGLPPFSCLTDPNAEWFKDGQPYPYTNFNGPGQYRVLCKDENGCILKEYIFSVPDGQAPPCFQQWVCADEVVGIPNPCPLESTVQWFKDGQPYPMEVDFSIIPNGLGSYTAYCEDDLGNITVYRFEVYDCMKFFKKGGSSGIEEEKAEEGTEADFSVYPNPSKGFFTVQWDEMSSKQAATLYINDYSGRLIMQQFIESGQTETTFDLSDYAKGVYLLTYKTSSRTINRKITLF